MKTDKSSKRNWGIGIIVLYGAFLIFILALVVFASLQNFDVVERNYYEEATSYQNRINQMRNSQGLEERVGLALNQGNNSLEIQFPQSLAGKAIEGSVLLFRPSDAHRDVKLSIKHDTTGLMTVDATKLHPGPWRIKVSWRCDGVEYFDEDLLVIE